MKEQSKISITGEYTLCCVGEDGKLKWKSKHKNLVMGAALEAMAKLLYSPDPVASLPMNWLAIGTGTTAPVESNTQLVNETNRVERNSIAHDGKVTTVAFLFPKEVLGGNYRELGVFAKATSLAGSGILISRVLINKIIGLTDSLFVDYKFTIQNA